MCGITGWQVAEPGRFIPDDLGRMRHSLNHRGPDDHGSFLDSYVGVALAHNRLSIIDLSPRGHQPMVNPLTGDVLVFNGEIYNYRGLREQLVTTGHQFDSDCDTEVLLKAFAEWGIECVHRIRGMFAFAIWSPQRQSLFLARDTMGIKPLYIWQMNEGRGIVFASEIKAFLTLPGFSRDINRRSLDHFLEFGFGVGEETIFKGVSKLLPGTWIRIERGQFVEKQNYFEPPVTNQKGALETTSLVKQTFSVLDQVVSEHLVADVPVGILLSGGLDSSLIAALAARRQSIQTFTMGFADSAVDESPHARRVSDHIGSNHHELQITPQEVTENLEKNVRYFDDLFADWGMISTRLLYQKCRDRGIKVVIVGEGADELFGGYGIFKNALPGVLRGPRQWRIFQLYRQYAGRRYGRCYPEFARLVNTYLEQSDGDWFHAIRMFESRNQLPNNYVMKVDKASMAVSVEARVPYLDQRVADIAYRIPRDELIKLGDEKMLLKKVARKYNLLPEEIIGRQKFGAPLATSWMDDSEQFRAYAREVILANSGWTDELGFRDAMTKYFDKGQNGYPFPRSISVFRNLAWRLLQLNLWSRSYLEPARAG
jgi:asparagine synthase (glutamine-hydrolysing)